MEFQTLDISRGVGTSMVGRVYASFSELVFIFGRPFGPINDGARRCEWVVKFEDGTVACIYDWKQPEEDVKDVREWNVGGHGVDAWFQVGDVIREWRENIGEY